MTRSEHWRRATRWDARVGATAFFAVLAFTAAAMADFVNEASTLARIAANFGSNLFLAAFFIALVQKIADARRTVRMSAVALIALVLTLSDEFVSVTIDFFGEIAPSLEGTDYAEAAGALAIALHVVWSVVVAMLWAALFARAGVRLALGEPLGAWLKEPLLRPAAPLVDAALMFGTSSAPVIAALLAIVALLGPDVDLSKFDMATLGAIGASLVVSQLMWMVGVGLIASAAAPQTHSPRDLASIFA